MGKDGAKEPCLGPKAVRLTLRSRQETAGESETVERELAGTFTREGEKWTLSWTEPAQSGLGRTCSRLVSLPEGAALTRKGETRAKMLFRVGKPWAFDYETSYGAIPMAVELRRAGRSLTPAGGETVLDYLLAMDGGAPARVEMTLRFIYEKEEKEI